MRLADDARSSEAGALSMREPRPATGALKFDGMLELRLSEAL
jgi:hypothetical protein